MNKETVLVITSHGQEGPHFEILERAGFEVRRIPDGADPFVEDELISLLEGCRAVVASVEPYTEKVVRSLPDLRVIARSGVGYDAVDVAACDRAGVVVATTPGVNHHPVAEHTLALLLGVARSFPDVDRRVREGRWARVACPRVMGSTLGLVGLGRIGQAVATRALGLGMNIIACEPFPDREFIERHGIELTGLDDLLARSDYVSLHAPMNRENRHMMNAETFGKMKAGGVLINTARGGLVDEAALCEALNSGHLGGAGLDVFEQEPLPTDSPLLDFDNVLLSCHLAGHDEQAWHDTFTMVADTIIKLRQGEWPAERIRNLKGTTSWEWERD